MDSKTLKAHTVCVSVWWIVWNIGDYVLPSIQEYQYQLYSI